MIRLKLEPGISATFNLHVLSHRIIDTAAHNLSVNFLSSNVSSID